MMRPVPKIGSGLLLLALFLAGAGQPGFAARNPSAASPSMQEEARRLLAIEEQYFQDRLQSNWQAIYNRQHTKFKKRVPFPYFVNTNGLTAYDSPGLLARPQWGGVAATKPTAGVVEINRDPLGLAAPPKYLIIPSPWVRIDRHRYAKLWISKDGKFAKVDVKLDVTERLPPHLFKIDMVFPHTRDHTDYWEKIDGQWQVALMVHKTSVSGGKFPMLFVPNALDRYNLMEWIPFDPKTLKPGDPTDE